MKAFSLPLRILLLSWICFRRSKFIDLGYLREYEAFLEQLRRNIIVPRTYWERILVTRLLVCIDTERESLNKLMELHVVGIGVIGGN